MKSSNAVRTDRHVWVIITLMLGGFLGTAGTREARAGKWTQKAPMPTARYDLSSSVVNGKIYVLGGSVNLAAVAAVEQYDPATDRWETRASMPEAATGLATSTVDGILYAIGGGQGIFGEGRATVYAYDPTTDTWTRKADMPTPRFVLSASAVDGKIYAIGGKRRHGAAGMSAVEEYDPVSDRWTRKADMPTARFAFSNCVVDGRIYAMGGLAYQEGSGLRSVEEYDPATDTWTERADLPRPGMALATSVVHGRVYAIGGGPVLSAGGVTRVDEYDPVTDSWTPRDDMPTGRLFLSTSVVGGRIYAIGGSAQAWPWAGASIVEEYDLVPPPPDFNGDGRVDGRDVSILAEHWGEGASGCDIAPPPFGDGLVDVRDLIVLAEYIGVEIDDPTLLVHWPLDETQGAIALESVAGDDGTVVGVPLWQPAGGQVGGALQLDGTTYVTANFVLNPADGPFSVLAWVKGGAAGQVVISQVGGANWLGPDPITGTLMTELTAPGRSGRPLASSATIADGDWHRVGFAWNGSTRRLYVDDVLAAEDAQDELAGSFGGLNLGCGKDMVPDTYWTGLIDDVRIYNRAVKP